MQYLEMSIPENRQNLRKTLSICFQQKHTCTSGNVMREIQPLHKPLTVSHKERSLNFVQPYIGNTEHGEGFKYYRF